jgi:Fur family ferric uptake transcriptional regulator
VNSSKHERIQQECLEFLKVNGIDTDDTMEKVIGFFFTLDHHVSFEDIRQFIKKKNLKISDAVIKDVLDLLVSYGFAIEKVFGDNVVRYEHLHLGEHHDHFYCLKCGTIIEFFSPIIENAQLEEAGVHGFHPFSHKMQIHGLCSRCFGKSSTGPVSLTMIESGGKFRITGVDSSAGAGLKTHLIDMGMVPGVEGEVLTNHGGRTVIHCNGTRTALGRGMSQKIKVVVIN